MSATLDNTRGTRIKLSIRNSKRLEAEEKELIVIVTQRATWRTLN